MSLLFGAITLGAVAACKNVRQPNDAAASGSAIPDPFAGAPASDGATADGATAPRSGGGDRPLIDISSTHGDKSLAAGGAAINANGGATTATPVQGGSATAAPTAAASGSAAAAQISAEELKKSQGLLVERDASLLKELGGTYLCDQRVYPSGGGAHISAWEWSFPVSPASLAETLGGKVKGASRAGLTIRLGENVVVDIKDGASGKSTLGCLGIPVTTKSLVVVSTR
jgi:hypothetical protein